MKKRIIPFLFIVISASILVGLNEYTEISIPPGFSYIIIIGSMIAGVWISKSLNSEIKIIYSSGISSSYKLETYKV